LEVKMYQTILVPLDGKPENEAGLDHAAALAKAFGAKLILFRVVPHPVYPPARYSIAEADPWLSTQQKLKEEAVQYLDHLIRQPELRSLPVERVVGEGPTYHVILKAIEEYGADLVILTKKRRSRLVRWILGSTPKHIVHESPVPVLLVRA
jgi:nucleotide-binding universal stress UspA family protein